MAVNEQISTGNFYRHCIDATTKLWQRMSFWTKSSDVEFNDGKTAEAKVGAIKGLTSSLNVTQTGYAADAKVVSDLNTRLNFSNASTDGTLTLANAIKAVVTQNFLPTQTTKSFYLNSTEGYYTVNISRSGTNAYSGTCIPLNNSNTNPPYYVQGEIGGADSVTPFKKGGDLSYFIGASGGVSISRTWVIVDTANYNHVDIYQADINKGYRFNSWVVVVTDENTGNTIMNYTEEVIKTIDISQYDKIRITIHLNGQSPYGTIPLKFY